MSMQVIQDRAADGLVATSAVAAGISLSSVLQIVQIVAGCVAILSGLCAAYYYIKKANAK